MNRLTTLPAVAFAACASFSALAAQDLGARLHAYPGALARLSIDGLPRLAEHFEETNVGAMLADEAVVSLWDELRETVTAESPELERAFEFGTGYRGRMTVVVTATEPTIYDPPKFGAFFWFPGDGETPFDEIVAIIDEASEEAFEDLDSEYLGFGEESFRLIDSPDGDGIRIAFPQVVDGGLFFAIGQDLDAGMRRLFEAELVEAGTATGAPIEFEANLGQVVGWLPTLLTQDPTFPGTPEVVESVLDVFGLRQIDRLSLATSADGEFMRHVTTMTEKPGGQLVELLVPAGRSESWALAPSDAMGWSSFRFDPSPLVDRVLEVSRAIAGDDQVDGFLAQFESELGVDLISDLIAPIGDDHLFVNADIEAPDFDAQESELSMSATGFDGLVLAMKLDDAARFEENVMKALRSQGLHAMFRSRDYRDAKVRTAPVLGILPLHYTIVDGYLVLSTGRMGVDRLQSVVDRLADRRDNKEPPAFPESIQKRIDACEDGWVGLSVSGIPFDLLSQVGSLATEDQLFEEEADAADRAMLRLFEVFGEIGRRYDLEHSVTTTYRGEDEIRQVQIW